AGAIAEPAEDDGLTSCRHPTERVLAVVPRHRALAGGLDGHGDAAPGLTVGRTRDLAGDGAGFLSEDWNVEHDGSEEYERERAKQGRQISAHMGSSGAGGSDEGRPRESRGPG